MKKKNLRYQMTSSVANNHNEKGTSKRSIKLDPTANIKEYVYSFSERERLMDICKSFADFINQNYSEIKMVRDITKPMVLEFLQSNHKTNGGKCNSNTVYTMAQSIDKLSHLVNKNFKVNTDWKIEKSELIADNKKSRDLWMQREHLNAALSLMKDGTDGKIGIQLAAEFGLRVAEVTKLQLRDIDFENGKLHIHESKGGKSRNISIDDAQKVWLKDEIKERGIVDKNARLCPIKDKSVCNLLSKCLKKAGYPEYAEAKTSIHSLRKMRAQELYEDKIPEHQSQGNSYKNAEKKARGDTNEFLGHGRGRTLDSYIIPRRG